MWASLTRRGWDLDSYSRPGHATPENPNIDANGCLSAPGRGGCHEPARPRLRVHAVPDLRHPGDHRHPVPAVGVHRPSVRTVRDWAPRTDSPSVGAARPAV